MARVLYTSRIDGKEAPGFVEADELVAAKQALEQAGHREIRFWSHPLLGDADGADPIEALRRVPQPTVWQGRLALALLLLALPGTCAFWAIVFLGWFGMLPAWLEGEPPSPHALLVVTSSVGSLFATCLLQLGALQVLRRSVQHRDLRLASALLWTMRLGVPLLIPVLEIWAVRIRAARHGLDAAMRPYAWMRAVGLTRAHGILRNEALDQLGLVDERIEDHRARMAAAPSPQIGVELALLLVLHRRDVAGARSTLERTPDGGGPLVEALRPFVQLLIELEEKVPDRVEVVDVLERNWMTASQGHGHTWRPLFAVARARALALSGDVAGAERSFRDARALLWSGDIDVLDRGAADVMAARRRR